MAEIKVDIDDVDPVKLENFFRELAKTAKLARKFAKAVDLSLDQDKMWTAESEQACTLAADLLDRLEAQIKLLKQLESEDNNAR